MATRSLDILVGGRNNTGGVFASVHAGIDGLAGSLFSLRNILAGAFAGLTAGLTFKSIFDAASEAEEAVSGLRAALTLAGTGTDAAVKTMQDFATSIEHVTTLSDEAVLRIATIGVNIGKFTGETLKDATVAAIGLGKRLGVEAPAAMELLSKAAQGNTSTLGRYGIVLGDTLTTQQKFNAILKLGAESFALAEAETGTMSGKLLQLKEASGDFLEVLGGGLAGALSPMLDVAKNAIIGLTEGFGRFAAFVTPIMGQVREALASAFTFWSENILPVQLADFGMIEAAVVALWQAVSEAATGIGTAISVAFSFVGNIFAGLGIELGGLKETFQVAFITMEYAFKNWREYVELGLLSVTLGLVKFYNEVEYAVGIVGQHLVWLGENWRNILTDMYNFTATVVQNMYKNLTAFFSAVTSWLKGDGFNFEWTGLLKGFESTLTKLPEIVERHKGPLEEALEGMVGDLGNSLATGFLDFLNRRLKETNAGAGIPEAIKNAFTPSASGKGAVGGILGVPTNGTMVELTHAVNGAAKAIGFKNIGLTTGVADTARQAFDTPMSQRMVDWLTKPTPALSPVNKIDGGPAEWRREQNREQMNQLKKLDLLEGIANSMSRLAMAADKGGLLIVGADA